MSFKRELLLSAVQRMKHVDERVLETNQPHMMNLLYDIDELVDVFTTFFVSLYVCMCEEKTFVSIACFQALFSLILVDFFTHYFKNFLGDYLLLNPNPLHLSALFVFRLP